MKFRSKLKIDRLKISEEIKSTQSVNSYFLHEILFNAKNNKDAKEKYDQIIKSIDENGVEIVSGFLNSYFLDNVDRHIRIFFDKKFTSYF